MFNNDLYKKIGASLILVGGIAALTSLGGCGFGQDYDSPFEQPTPTPEPTPGPEPTPTPEPTPGPDNPWLGITLLMQNTGLEDSDTETTGWVPQGGVTMSVSTDTAFAGSNSLLVADRTDTWQGAGYDLVGKLESNTAYVFSAYVRAVSPDTTNVKITVKTTDDGTDSYSGVSDEVTATDTDWVELRGNFTTGDLTNVTAQFAYVEGPASGISYYIDEFTVRLAVDSEVPNGDLESEENTVDPWKGQGSATVTLDSSIANSGNNSVLVANRTQNWEGGAYDLFGVLEANTDYLISVSARMSSPAEENLKVTIKTTENGEAAYNGVAGDTVVSDTGWTTISGNFSTGDLTNVTEFLLYVESANATASYYLDDLMVQLSPAVDTPNGDIEADATDVSPWYGQGSPTLAVDSTDGFAHGGSNSLSVSARTQNWEGAAYSIIDMLEDNRRYLLTAYVRMDEPISGDIAMTVKRVETGQSDSYTNIGTVTASDTGWTEISGTYDIGDMTDVTDLFLYFESPDATASFFVDDLSVEQR